MDVVERMPVFPPPEDDDSSLFLCVTSPCRPPPEQPHTSANSHLSPSSRSKLSSLPQLLRPVWWRSPECGCMRAHLCVFTYGNVWETPLCKWWAKKNYCATVLRATFLILQLTTFRQLFQTLTKTETSKMCLYVLNCAIWSPRNNFSLRWRWSLSLRKISAGWLCAAAPLHRCEAAFNMLL